MVLFVVTTRDIMIMKSLINNVGGMRTVALVFHIRFNKYQVRVEEVKQQGIHILRAPHTVHTTSVNTVESAASVKEYSRTRKKKKQRKNKQYVHKQYTAAEERMLDIEFGMNSSRNKEKVRPQSGFEGGRTLTLSRADVCSMIDAFDHSEADIQDITQVVSQCSCGDDLNVIYEAIGYTFQEIVCEERDGEDISVRRAQLFGFLSVVRPLLTMQAELISSEQLVRIQLQSGMEMRAGHLYDPTAAIEERISGAIFAYRPTPGYNRFIGSMISQLTTVGLIRHFREVLDDVINMTYAIRYLDEESDQVYRQYVQLREDVRPVLLVQEQRVLNALSRGIDLQSGDEECAPAQLEPLVFWDDVETNALRSPQSGESAFSYASSSSESTFDKVRETLVDCSTI